MIINLNVKYLRSKLIFQIIICLPLIISAQTKSSSIASKSINSLTGGRQLLVKPFENRVFIKELGQFARNARELKTPLTEPVLYGVENSEFSAYFTAHGIIFQFPERKNIEEKDREKINGEPEEKTVETTWHSSQMLWLNTNAATEVIPEEKVSEYYNYGGFANDSTINFVPAYKKLKYINLYPGVDAEFELSEKGGIKYKFIVKPNVVIPAISFQWKGVNNIGTDEKGDLHIRSKFNPVSINPEWQLVDHQPNAFTSDSHTNIPVKYSVTDSTVLFHFSSEKISSPEGIVIDPWITNPVFPGLNRAYDIQEDSIGNVFVHGNYSQSSSSNSYHVQKYSSSGTLIWTYITYSIFLGDIAVDNPGNVYIIGGYCAGKRQKLNSAGVQQWVFAGLCEEWRLAFNYSKTTLAVCGYFVNPGGNNLAKLDMATGAISSQIAYNEETRSISTDCNGDMYSLHLPSSNLRKTNADFTPGGVAASGLSLIYSGTGYAYNPDYNSAVFQGFNGNVITGPSVYIYDGTKLRRFNKATLTAVNDVIVPNGVNYQCSGLAADACGNIYAGTTSGIVVYDSALNYISTIPTTGAVYDLLSGGAGDLLACGEGFLGRFSINCAPPPPLTLTTTSTNAACRGGTSSVVATGGFAPYSYHWEPGGQTTASMAHLAPGTYTCSITDPFCHSSIDSITVAPTLSLHIISDTNIVTNADLLLFNPTCKGFNNGSAAVTATGGKPPYTYSWNTIPVQTGDTAISLTAGTYIVTVLDADTCAVSAHITLIEPPLLTAVPTQTPISCFADTDGSATVTAGGGTVPYTYSWNTSPAQTTAAALNLGDGSYTCTVTDSNSCIASASVTLVQPLLVFIDHIPADTICAGQSSTLTALAHGGNPGGYTYTWNPLHNGSVNIVAPPNTATYSVTAMDSKSCSSYAQTVTVEVDPLPTAVISGSASVCKNSSPPQVTFTGGGSTPPYTFTYSLNGGASQTVTSTGNSVSISAPTVTPGTFTYTLISVKDAGSRTCSQLQSGTAIVAVHPLPVSLFGDTRVCQGISTQFSDSSTTAAGNINAWSWNYGDASPLGTVQNPSRLYAAGGMYNVTLIVTNNFGCADTITKPVRVYYNPVADFSHVDVCFGDSLPFINTSTVTLPDSLSSYLWAFGDLGPTGSTASPAHFYSQAGIYNVTLLSRTAKGCSNAMTHAVKAYDAPQSAFSKNNICLFDSAVFSNTTIPPLMGSTASWTWNYGDNSGLNTTVWSPVHHYLLAGHYQVTLISRSSNLGCADTLKDSITVYPMPIAGYSFSNVCLNQQMIFNDSSRVSSGSIAAHSWNFGDGSSPNGNPNPSHLYANPGTRPVTLIVTSNYGCKDTIVKNTVVHPLPHARIYALDVCNGTTVQFADSSNIASSDTIHRWRWNYADNSALSSTQNTSHLYGSSGVYAVQLFITSYFGCVDSVIRTITVNPNPIVGFTSSDSIGCERLCITFHNTSTVTPGTNTAWVWNYGDLSSSGSGQNPYHCYSNDSVFAPNILDVTLTVTSDSGCVSTKTINHYITVYPAPSAGFTAFPGSTSIINPVITITDQSIGTNFWHWNFGDQDTTSIQHPLPHTYADTGTYRITLIASTLYNCIDTTYQTIFIEPDFIFYIPNSFTPNDDGINDIFMGKGIFIKEYEMMIFDRWGNLIFYSDDALKGWDGTANHGTETAQQDIYVYKISITDFNKRKHSYKGKVTLVR